MNVTRKKNVILCTVIILFIFLLAVSIGLVIQNEYLQKRKEEADNFLTMYIDNISLVMREQLNYANDLANIEPEIMEEMPCFEWKAKRLLAEKNVEFIFLFVDDTVQAALLEKRYDHVIGKNMRDFSLIYTMPKAMKTSVVEGPVSLEGTDKAVFLFLEPLLENGEYKGEIAVALGKDYVIEQMNLGRLAEAGYEYYLWKVNSQDGSKDIIACSDQERDFSYASKARFYLSSQWSLSIMPSEGWVSRKTKLFFLGVTF